jgi:hypothetical protein
MTSAQEYRDLGRIDPDFQGTGRRVGLTGWEAFRVSGMVGGELGSSRCDALLGPPVMDVSGRQ